MRFNESEWCNFTWDAEHPEYTILCMCFRKAGHEGNHVSHPSGEEAPQTSSNDKQIIDKTNEYKNLQLTS